MNEEEIGRLLGMAVMLANKAKEYPGLGYDAREFIDAREQASLTPAMLAAEGEEMYRKLGGKI